jgi:hypothetical protein
VTATLVSAVFVAFLLILASNYKSPTDTYITDAQPKVHNLSLSLSLSAVILTFALHVKSGSQSSFIIP